MNVLQRSCIKDSGHCHRRNDDYRRGQLPSSNSRGIQFPTFPLHSRMRQSGWKLKMSVEEDPVPDGDQTESLAKPNYAIWIFTFMTVIGIFYGVVFYAGAGLFYFLSKKIGFQKKEYIPYTERMEQEREALKKSIEQMKEAPVLQSTAHSEADE